jgi:uncharacterized protein YndB with AHSA1/START domain
MNAAIAPAAVVVRRTIAASPEVLFDAWLDPIALATWMRPGSTHNTQATVDARVGGSYEIVMHIESGTVPHRGVYRAIERPRRLAFTWESPHTGEHPTLVTVDFVPRDGRTEVIITHEQLPEAKMQGHTNGWTSALEKLEVRYGAKIP